MRRIILPALVLSGFLAPILRADDKLLLEQPLSEYKARRQALMKRVKEADAGGMLVRARGGDGAAEGGGGRRGRRSSWSARPRSTTTAAIAS